MEGRSGGGERGMASISSALQTLNNLNADFLELLGFSYAGSWFRRLIICTVYTISQIKSSKVK